MTEWIKPSVKLPPRNVEVCVMSEHGLVTFAKLKKNGVWVTAGKKSHPIRVLAWCEVNNGQKINGKEAEDKPQGLSTGKYA